MKKDIIYMTEKELLNKVFSFIFKVKFVNDMYVPVDYEEIGLEGQHNEFNSKLIMLHDKDEPCYLMNDKGNFYGLEQHFTNSSYAEFYGKSEIFNKKKYIEAVCSSLPIVLTSGNFKKYYNIIDHGYNVKKFDNELVAKANINSSTRDMFYGDDKELKVFIKDLKKLDKRK